MSEKLTPFNVGKLGVKQATLTDLLRKDIAIYVKYRKLRALGVKVKSPFTLSSLQRRQAEINKIRKQLYIQRIRCLQDLKRILKREGI